MLTNKREGKEEGKEKPGGGTPGETPTGRPAFAGRPGGRHGQTDRTDRLSRKRRRPDNGPVRGEGTPPPLESPGDDETG